MYSYDKDEIKQNLTIEQVEEVLAEFGGEPQRQKEIIVSKTICHCGQSHKLYYYDNTHLFRCYTGCVEPTFDIFELTRKVLSREQPKARENSEWNLPEAIDFIAKKFGFSPNEVNFDDQQQNRDDFKLFERYDRIKDINVNTQEVELKEYEDAFLKNLPHPKIQPWLDEGISQEVMDDAEICYDPKNQGIVIPHRDINNRLIGIRERTLIKEQAELYGKYLPAKFCGKMYNHPLSFNLYNLNHSKKNIFNIGKVIIVEGEKSCLKYRTYFGEENDITVATCGQNLLKYQMELLYNVGAKEYIIAWDREGAQEDKTHYVQKFYNLQKKYGAYYNLSFIYDKEGKYLDYKMSPLDAGKEVFLQLYKERIFLNNGS